MGFFPQVMLFPLRVFQYKAQYYMQSVFRSNLIHVFKRSILHHGLFFLYQFYFFPFCCMHVQNVHPGYSAEQNRSWHYELRNPASKSLRSIEISLYRAITNE